MTESASKNINLGTTSKKDKLHSKPEIEEDSMPSPTKIRTESTLSKQKLSSVKNNEETEEEIKAVEETNEDKNQTTSKRSFKPFTEHIKTPFSKLKEKQESVTPSKFSVQAVVSAKKIDFLTNNDEENVLPSSKHAKTPFNTANKEENKSPIKKSEEIVKKLDLLEDNKIQEK